MPALLPFVAVLLIIPLACLAGGYGWLRLAASAEPLPWEEQLLSAWALGFTIVGWPALLAAELGWFSLPQTALCAAALGGLPWVVARRPSLPLPRPNRTALWLALWALPAVWLFGRSHQYAYGGADAGVYVNLAAQIARSGSIVFDDPLLATLDPALADHLLLTNPWFEHARYALFPAFYVTDPAAPRVTPQFYPLHPVWQAIAYTLGGVRAALLLPGLWALWGALAVWLTARDLGGRWMGVLALAGMTLNGLQVWFARYPTTETLTQALLWTGVWALGRWLQRPGRLWPLLAGLLWGQVLLVRIDMFFLLLLPLGIAGLWMVRRSAVPPAAAWLLAPLLGLALHSYAHAWFQSRPYFLTTFGAEFMRLRADGVWPALAAAVALSGGLLAARWALARPELWRRRIPALRLLACAALLGLALYGWFVRPLAPAAAFTDAYTGTTGVLLDAQTFVRLGWYLTPFGVWLGVAGVCLLIWRGDRRVWPALGVGLIFALLYLWRLRAGFHQVYAMRRLLPAVVPLVILGGAAAIQVAALWRPRRAPRAGAAVALLIAALWLGGLLTAGWRFIRQVDAMGSVAQIAALSAQLPPDALLIFNDGRPYNQGELLGTALRFLHGQDALTLRRAESLDVARFAQQVARWEREGRPIFWVEIPEGAAWPLPARPLRDPLPYEIVFDTLESTAAHKPSALFRAYWAGVIWRVGAPDAP